MKLKYPKGRFFFAPNLKSAKEYAKSNNMGKIIRKSKIQIKHIAKWGTYTVR